MAASGTGPSCLSFKTHLTADFVKYQTHTWCGLHMKIKYFIIRTRTQKMFVRIISNHENMTTPWTIYNSPIVY